MNLTVTQKICYLDDNLIKKNNYKRSVSNLDEEIPLIDIEVKNSPGSEKIPQKSINVRLKMVHSDVLDWKRPVYLKCDSKLKRISRPKISFFKLSQVEFLFSSGNIKLAQMMMVVLSAPNQPQRMSSEYASKYTELVSLLFPQLSTFKSNGMRTPLKLSHISSPSFKTIKVEVSSILKPSLSLDSSPHTPELKNSTMMALCGRSSSFDTNYSDVKTMAMEIDDIIRRNHGILEDVVQKIDSKNSENLIAKAASSLKEISAENRFNSKLIYPRSELRRKSPPMNKGSQFVFGLVTPSKRVRDELDSTAVISPIRRSMRIKNNEKYYENLNEIPNLSEHGFLPNPSIPLVRKKAGPGQNIKSINYKGETKR